MGRKWRGAAIVYEFLFLSDENTTKLFVLMVAQLGEYIKNNWIVYFTWMSFMWIVLQYDYRTIFLFII